MAQKSAIQTAIDKQHQPALDALQKDHDVQLPGLRALVERLTKAMAALDAKTLAALRAPYDAEVKRASELVVRAGKLGGALGKLAPKDAADVKAVAALRSKFEKLNKILESNLLKLKGGQDMLQDALDKASGAAEKFTAEWARISDLIERYAKNTEWRVKQSAGFLAKAKAAVVARDRKELETLKKQAADFRAGNPPQSEVSAAWRAFQARAAKNTLDAHAKDQLARELPQLETAYRAAEALEAPIARDHMAIEGLKVKAPDKAAAVQLLGVPAASRAMFQDALSLPVAEMEKYLNDVGKTLKPARTGKQMIDELRKAKLL